MLRFAASDPPCKVLCSLRETSLVGSQVPSKPKFRKAAPPLAGLQPEVVRPFAPRPARSSFEFKSTFAVKGI